MNRHNHKLVFILGFIGIAPHFLHPAQESRTISTISELLAQTTKGADFTIGWQTMDHQTIQDEKDFLIQSIMQFKWILKIDQTSIGIIQHQQNFLTPFFKSYEKRTFRQLKSYIKKQIETLFNQKIEPIINSTLNSRSCLKTALQNLFIADLDWLERETIIANNNNAEALISMRYTSSTLNGLVLHFPLDHTTLDTLHKAIREFLLTNQNSIYAEFEELIQNCIMKEITADFSNIFF